MSVSTAAKGKKEQEKFPVIISRQPEMTGKLIQAGNLQGDFKL